MKISIIIPSYNKWELTNQRLIELNQWCKNDIYQVVLIDDASEEQFGHLNFWKEVLPWVFYRNEKNMGFGFSMNKGAEIATGDVFVFLSNDVLVRSNFIGEIKQIINKDRQVLIGHRLVDFAGGWNEVYVRGHNMIIPYLEGYFLACHKDVWKTLGGFDDIYSPYCYEDIDLSVTAWKSNIKLETLTHQNLRHLVARTAPYDEERQKITERNRVRFIEKWIDKL